MAKVTKIIYVLLSVAVLSSLISAPVQAQADVTLAESEDEKTVFEKDYNMGQISNAVTLVDIQQQDGNTLVYVESKANRIDMIWFTEEDYGNVNLRKGENVVKIPYSASKIGIGAQGKYDTYPLGGTEVLPDSLDPRYTWGIGLVTVLIGLYVIARYKIRNQKTIKRRVR